VGAGVYSDHDVEREERDDASFGVDYYGISGGLSLRRALGAGGELAFSSTLAFGYAAGVGTVPGVTLDPVVDLGSAPSLPIDVLFHELTLSLASGLEF